MADSDLASIARESKALQQSLKELIRTHDPWDREVEFQRKSLQKQFLLLLLGFPYVKESQDAETHLWMQTSYALITPYKQRITAVEQALREASTQRRQGQQQQRHGPVEHRKLLQRFKQFLANEEKFWTQLVTRLHRQFNLTEADTALAALNIPVSNDPDEKPDGRDESRRGHDRSSHFRFPAEPSDPQPPTNAVQRASQLATLSKALICLGDLARYREQYSDAGARRDGDASRRGGRRGGGRQNQSSTEIKPRTYDKARACYERARNLVPDEGNASHQLAILASYQKDTFESLVHYYRSFCVRVPYDPAPENMGNILAKFLRSWKGKRSRNMTSDTGGAQPRNRFNTFKDSVAALHALWEQSVDAVDSYPDHEQHIISEFGSLVAGRALPIDSITKVVVIVQGAHWHHRPSSSRKNAPQTGDIGPLEARIITHALSLYTSLFQVGIAELQESSKIAEDDLAMRLTAVLRRMLPALRLASKWLRARSMFDVLLNVSPGRIPTAAVSAFRSSFSTFRERLSAIFPPSRLPRLNRPLEEDLEFAGFLPLGGLLMDRSSNDPQDSRSLEEVHPNEEQLMRISDVCRDFSLLPAEPRSGSLSTSFRAQPRRSQPPEAETMIPAAPQNVGRPSSDVKHPDTTWNVIERPLQDDDARTETTDPVGDAFRQALLTSDTEDEQDEIVWNPRPGRSPTISPPQARPMQSSLLPSPPQGRLSSLDTVGSTPASYAVPVQSSIHPGPGAGAAVPHTPKTTAQDLLANVLGPSRTPVGRPRRVSLAQGTPVVSSPLNPLAPPPEPAPLPQPHLLFGGTSSNTTFGPGHSIWSASPDESSLGMRHRHNSLSGPIAPSVPATMRVPAHQLPPQGPWLGTPEHVPPVNVQRVQHQIGIGPSPGYGVGTLPQVGHRRVASSTMPSHSPYALPSGSVNLDNLAMKPRHRDLVGALPALMDSAHISSNVIPGTVPLYSTGPLAGLPHNIHSHPPFNAIGAESAGMGSLAIGGAPYGGALQQEIHGTWGGAG